jgi:DNA-binding transcriptional LysR family regulator
MGVQLHQLRYVVAVAEEGHFTRAAARLHVAQPSVSNSVRTLERELGTPLFHRSRAAVTLTSAGEAFLPWARQALVDCEGGRAAVRELIGLRRGRLSLGATPSLTTNLLPPVLAGFHERYPGIELALHEAGSGDLVVGLEHGRLDVALVILPVTHSWVQTTPMMDEELVLAVHPGHPLVGRDSITLEELRDVPLVLLREGYDLRQTTVAACRRAGFEPIVALDGGEMDGVVALTAAGLGAAVLPATVVRPGGPLRAVRFRDRSLVRTIGIAARRDRPLPHAARAFVQVLEVQLARDRDREG